MVCISFNMSTFAATLIFTVLTMQPAMGFPGGAGSCVQGNAAAGFGHGEPGGSIAQGGYTVTLDSKPLIPGVTTNFVVGKKHVLTLKANSSTSFAGLLFRLGGINATSALSVTGGDSTLQVAANCANDGASGITHVFPDPKKSSSASLLVNRQAKGLKLDVTIVGEGLFDNFHSGYVLNAVIAPLSPTKMPTMKPTAKPAVPTIKPITKPTRRPSYRPSARPTRRPTQLPTHRPTHRPSRHPTRRPTQRPTRHPTRRPTRRPTSRPTPQTHAHRV